jgi:hypothetical protein
MTTLRALALVLVALACLPSQANAEAAAANGQKLEASALDGLAFIVTINPAAKNKPRPAPFATLAATGHTLTFQNGKMVLTVQGLPPIPPISFQATRNGDLVRIVCPDGVEVIDKANKSALVGDLVISGTISDAGKNFIGTMTWTVGETKQTKKKVEINFDGVRPEKPEKK